MKLDVERLTSWSAIAAIRPEWEALAQSIRPWTPFATPVWNELWWKYYSKSNWLAHDELAVRIARNEVGRLVAVAPMMRRRTPGRLLPGLRVLDFFGSDPSITEIRGIVCAPAEQMPVAAALRDHVRQGPREADLVNWHGLYAGSWPANSDTQTASKVRAEAPDYVLALPDSWEKVLASVSSNMRKSVRKAYEFLERDGHRCTFRVAGIDADWQTARDTFYRLHKARAADTEMTVRHPDRFSVPVTRRFMDDYTAHMHAQGGLRFFEIEIGGDVIASRIAFQHDTDLYLYYSGFDPQWRKYSVATTLMAEIIKWAIEQQLSAINLSTGADLSKQRWQPREIALFGTTEQQSLRGSLLDRAYDTLAEIRRRQVRDDRNPAPTPQS